MNETSRKSHNKASRWGYISFLTGIILTIFVMVLYKQYNKIFQASAKNARFLHDPKAISI